MPIIETLIDVYKLVCYYTATFIFICLICTGVNSCQKTYTLSQARVILNADVNSIEQAQAQVVLQTGVEMAKEKLNHQKQMDLIQRGAMVVSGACIVLVIVLVYVNMGKLAFIPLACFIGCLWSITFIEMDSHYPKFLPIAGGCVTLIFGGMAVYYFIVKRKVFGAFEEVVGNVEQIKNMPLGGDPSTVLKMIKIPLVSQSDTTKALVAKIKAKL
jgi:hypothetical protein